MTIQEMVAHDGKLPSVIWVRFGRWYSFSLKEGKCLVEVQQASEATVKYITANKLDPSLPPHIQFFREV